jgi:hypothetical protein
MINLLITERARQHKENIERQDSGHETNVAEDAECDYLNEYEGNSHVLSPNVQDEPRPWLARAVLLGARIVTAMVVGSGALLAVFTATGENARS